jgi:cysteinyl-tRNA synthetase
MFTGNNALLEKAFTPMTIRFYMLQAHYSSPVDFSNEALKAAEQGLNRMMKGISLLPRLKAGNASTVDVITLQENAYKAWVTI